MHFLSSLSPVLLLSFLVLTPGCYPLVTNITENETCSSILWRPCADAARFDCASFQVPLDYLHPEVGNATLAVARLKATKQPRLGTIFTNPGGPGGSGVEFLTNRAGVVISTITQGQYDIVSWDPRGVNQSRPQISCGFTSDESLSQFLGDTILGVGLEARGNFTDQDDLDAFFGKVNETDAKIVQTGQRCLESDGSFLKYMGTTAVARDMVSLADCIEGPGKPVNYWGFSYGTVIGNYFINMFPERVGRVIIDGVVDSIGWATEPSYKMDSSSFSATESVLAAFAEKCAQAGPRNCTLATNGSTPASILQGVRQLIDTAYDLHESGNFDISSFDVRGFIAGELYTPVTWNTVLVPQLESWAAALANQTTKNVSNGSEALLRLRSRVHDSRMQTRALTSGGVVDPAVLVLFSDMAITCVDSIDQDIVTTQRVFEEVVRVTHELTPNFGEVAVTQGPLYCHRFPIRAVERFMGPFNHTLANPIIVIGNTGDPITPFANARKIAATLGSSAHLLQQDGFGHTSLGENSDCTQGVVRDYFLHGALPRQGQICETDQALFPINDTLISHAPIFQTSLGA